MENEITKTAEVERDCISGHCRACNGILAVTVDDDTSDSQHVAKFAGDLVRSGLRIDRVATEFVRDTANWCKCKRAKKGAA